MYQPLPLIREDLDTLQARLHGERDPKRKPRLHLLVLLKSGQVTSRSQAATHLALHRNTVAAWLRRSRDGGLEALLTYKEAGAPAGQKTLPPPVFEQLKTRLATPPGFASYLDVQRWLHEEFALEVPYKTLHGIVHYQLKAKLKRPRPSHAKKTSRKPRTLSSSARAAWAPSPP
jgi:transposase